MTFQQFKSTYGRNPWAKVKVNKPSTFLSRGGWITVKGLEREVKTEKEYDLVQDKGQEALDLIAGLFKVPNLKDQIKVVLE